MDGWRVRRGVAGDLSGDVPFVVGALMLAGAALGAVGAFAWDKFAHHHRGTLR